MKLSVLVIKLLFLKGFSPGLMYCRAVLRPVSVIELLGELILTVRRTI